MHINANSLQPLTLNSGKEGQLQGLTDRLEDFYNTFHEYPAFANPSKQTVWLELVASELKRRLKNNDSRVRVLEAGAGAGSDLAAIEGLNREAIHYTAQDIATTVSPKLLRIADAVHLGPLHTLQSQFDVIFSLFVVEHITEPAKFFSEVDRLLAPGGTHIVICPRYDFPGYICPSMRHLKPLTVLRIESLRVAQKCHEQLRGETPGFWINTEPAVFHRKWVRDADAVHLVSGQSVSNWHVERGYKCRQLKARSAGVRDWFTKRFLTLCLECQKADPNTSTIGVNSGQKYEET